MFSSVSSPLFYLLLLHKLPYVGSATLIKLLDAFGSAEAVFEQDPAKLTHFLTPEALSALRECQAIGQAAPLVQSVLADLDWLDQQPDVGVIDIHHADYPPLLKTINKPPALLFVRGNLACLSLPQIAVVGSRSPTQSGSENAWRFAEYLAARGFAITSGLALGVDGAAHQGALAAEGVTIAVTGTGIDRIYPARHKGLATSIVDAGGAIISEFPLGTSSKAAHFPQRNRIISGLSLGVLVVEAAVQSGSLITAHQAIEQNREVFAIPGSIHNPLARGCHQLIRQGAHLVETAQDIVDQLGSQLALQRELTFGVQPAMGVPELPDDLTVEARQLVEAMGFDSISVDELVERTALGAGDIAAELIGLEIRGLVAQVGASYQRVMG